MEVSLVSVATGSCCCVEVPLDASLYKLKQIATEAVRDGALTGLPFFPDDLTLHRKEDEGNLLLLGSDDDDTEPIESTGLENGDRIWVAPHAQPSLECTTTPCGSMVLSARLSPCGMWCAVGVHPGTVMLLNVTTGESSIAFRSNTAENGTVADITENHIIASADNALVVHSRHANTTRILQRHTAQITCLAVSPSGSHVISGGYDRRIKYTNLETLKEVWYQRFPEAVHCVAVSPCGRWVGCGRGEGRITVFRFKSDEEVLSCRAHAGMSVSCIAFSPCGRAMATGGHDASLCLWETGTAFTQVATMTGHIRAVSSTVFSPCGSWVLSASHDGTIRQWDTRTASPLKVLRHPWLPMCLALSRCGRYLLWGGGNHAVVVSRVHLNPVRFASRVDYDEA